MRQELKPIAGAMLTIIQDQRASRIERVEAAKVLLSCHGQFVPDVDERWLSVRQLTAFKQMKQKIVERVLKQKERKQRANRKAYLRRTITKLEEHGSTEAN